MFADGRKGHENQTRGLLNAFTALNENRLELETYWFKPDTSTFQLKNHPRPQLILGAGHATHLPVLRARVLYGGVTVLLMKPSIPAIFFDMVLVPHHDFCSNFGNVHYTLGVLNVISQTRPEPTLGAILLGGTSRHFKWDNERISANIHEICNENPDKHWKICDSPRSPDDVLRRIEEYPNVTKYSWRETNEDFIPSVLGSSSEIWVSCDSVSMVYEAVSTGVPVGILELDSARRNNKVHRGLNELAAAGYIQYSGEGFNLHAAEGNRPKLSESTRCAKLVLQLIGRKCHD